MTQQEIQSPYLTTDQVAAYLQLSPRTVEKFRLSGKGPDFFKLGGRVYYTLETIKEWANGRRRQSTSAA
jgi:hypothetical protein